MSDPAADPVGLTGTVQNLVWQDASDRPAWERAVIGAVRVVWAVVRDVAEGQITLRAMSLVYTTLLSLVPLLAISFSILKGFGVHNQIEPFLRNAMEPLGERRDEVVSQIVGFVDNVQVGVLGFVGFLMLFYTVVSLMQKIELAFNDVWQVSATRTIAERFKDYLSVIVVGPALVFASLGITATVMSDPLLERITSFEPVGMLVEFVGRLVPVIMVSLAFTSIYIFVPHTRVRFVPALYGGLVAGVLWNALGWAFAWFVEQANNYTAIYSGFATPILFMIWLYVGWLILLLGGTIAFYLQHPEYLPGRQLTGHFSAADRERATLQAVRYIGQCFYSGRKAPSAEEVASAVRIPANTVELLLKPLQETSLVALTDSSSPPGYLPGCPWESASVYQVLDTARHAALLKRKRGRRIDSDSAVEEILERQRGLTRDAFGDMSLKSLATEH